jgi:hypothetical protein
MNDDILRSRLKIKFIFPVSFGCFSSVLSVAYVHTLFSEQGKNSSKLRKLFPDTRLLIMGIFPRGVKDCFKIRNLRIWFLGKIFGNLILKSLAYSPFTVPPIPVFFRAFRAFRGQKIGCGR